MSWVPLGYGSSLVKVKPRRFTVFLNQDKNSAISRKFYQVYFKNHSFEENACVVLRLGLKMDLSSFALFERSGFHL